MRVLIIEDYRPIRDSVARGLREAGFAVDATGDGEEGLWFAIEVEYDVIVLDLMLPGLDGLTILKRLRAQKHKAHVLILSARDTVQDRVAGLNLGADDYLVKPFAFTELLARVQSLVRRRYEAESRVIQVADLVIDLQSRAVRRNEAAVELTAREYSLLEYLALRKGQTLTRPEIWEHIYDFNAELNSNVIDVYVGSLRKKLERNGSPRLIQIQRGLRYVLEETG
ncbi:MAG: response regulator transcription factor [bacterium]